MQNDMRVKLIAGLVVAGVFAGVWYWLIARPRPMPPQMAAPSVVEPLPAEQSEFEKFAATAVETAPTPGQDLPEPDSLTMRQLLEDLGPRARGGDAVAACRLAIELGRCRRALALNTTSFSVRIQRLAAGGLEGDELRAATERLTDAEEYNAALRDRCDGISDSELRSGPRFAYAAAKRGHVPSMLLFADATDMTLEDFFADPAYFETYRREAWPLFFQAFEAGHPAAAYLWSSANDSYGSNFLRGVMPSRWRKPAVANALLARISEHVGSARRAAHPQEAAVDEEASQLFNRYFSSSKWLDSFSSAGATPVLPSDKLFLAAGECSTQ